MIKARNLKGLRYFYLTANRPVSYSINEQKKQYERDKFQQLGCPTAAWGTALHTNLMNGNKQVGMNEYHQAHVDIAEGTWHLEGLESGPH